MLVSVKTFLARLWNVLWPFEVATSGPRSGPVSAPQDAAENKPNVFATGTFEHVTLYDLMVTLTHGRKSGKVDIRIGTHKALILVLEGEIVTALYQGSVGDEAVVRIFTDAEDQTDAEFFISKVNPKGSIGGRTVRTPTDKLLFQVAMALDEKRQVAV